MRAEYSDNDGLYHISDEKGAPAFDRFIAGIGWPTATILNKDERFQLHWAVIVGKVEGDEYVVIKEIGGSLNHMAEELTEWKDNLLIDRVLIDPSEIENMRFLRGTSKYSYDGLCHYRDVGETARGDTKWEHKDENWVNFRDRDTKAHLVLLTPDIVGSVWNGVDKYIELQDQGKLQTRAECPVLIEMMKVPDMQQRIKHPVVKACVWALLWLEKRKRNNGDKKKSNPRYGGY